MEAKSERVRDSVEKKTAGKGWIIPALFAGSVVGAVLLFAAFITLMKNANAHAAAEKRPP